MAKLPKIDWDLLRNGNRREIKLHLASLYAQSGPKFWRLATKIASGKKLSPHAYFEIWEFSKEDVMRIQSHVVIPLASNPWIPDKMYKMLMVQSRRLPKIWYGLAQNPNLPKSVLDLIQSHIKGSTNLSGVNPEILLYYFVRNPKCSIKWLYQAFSESSRGSFSPDSWYGADARRVRILGLYILHNPNCDLSLAMRIIKRFLHDEEIKEAFSRRFGGMVLAEEAIY